MSKLPLNKATNIFVSPSYSRSVPSVKRYLRKNVFISFILFFSLVLSTRQLLVLPSGSTSIAVTRSTKYRKKTGWNILHSQLINTHVMLKKIVNSIGTILLGKEGL